MILASSPTFGSLTTMALWVTAPAGAAIAGPPAVPVVKPPDAVPAPAADAPSDKTAALTETQMMDVELDAILAATREWLRSRSTGDQGLDADLMFLGEALVRSLHGGSRRGPAANWLNATALLAVEGIDHPLVHLGKARTLASLRGMDSPREDFEAALRDLVASKAPPSLIFMAATVAAAWEDDRDVNRARPYHLLRRDAYMQRVEEEAKTAGDGARTPAWVLETLTGRGARLAESLPIDLAREMAQRLIGRNDIDECLRETVQGALHKRIAWDERGSGFAHTVDSEQWKRFHEHLDKAYASLQRAWLADPRRPSAPTLLIGVAMAGGTPETEDEQFWFERAIKARLDHWEAWTALLWALRPRWGGSHEAMEAVGLRALATGRFDTHVPSVYGEALKGALEEGAGLEWLARPGTRDRIESLAKGYANSTLTWSREQAATLRLLAALAAGDHDGAVAIRDEPDFAYDDSFFDVMCMPADGVFRDVLALSGPHGRRVAAADEALRSGRFQEGLTEYRAVLDQLEREQAPLDRCRALRDRIATATMAAGLASGEWTDLEFQPGLFGWRRRLGTWMAESPRSVSGGGNGDRPFRLRCTVDPGRRFEIRATLAVLTLGFERADASILFNLVDEPDAPDYRCLSWYPKRDRFEVSRLHVGGESLIIPLPKEGKREVSAPTVTLQVWDDEFVLLVGDKTLHAGPLPPGDGLERGVGLSLGSRFNPPGASTSQFRNIAIRRLTERPAALDRSASEVKP